MSVHDGDELNARYVTVTAERFPYGLRCMDCDVPMPVGTRYSVRLVAMQADVPVVDVVCVACGLGLPHGDAA